MNNLLKILLVVLGGMLIGFSLGMITANSITLGGAGYWAITVVGLILGGFLIATGLAKKEKKVAKEEKTPEEIN
jgi:hypothetical protein